MALRCGLAVTLAALACGLGAALGRGSAQPPPGTHRMETVIQDDALLLHRPAAEVRRTAQRIASLGADRVRLTASWGALAPGTENRRKPRFDAADSRDYPREPFTRLDRAVKEVRRAGMEVMIDLAFFAPRWAVASGNPVDRRHAWRPSAHEFGLFARAVAERYSGHFADPADRDASLPGVRLWTTWNEPNHPVFLRPQWERVPARRPDRRGRPGRRRGSVVGKGGWRPASPHLYRRMHDAAYDQVKEVRPGNEVLIGGLASEAEPGRGARRGIGPLRFTRELACVGASLRPLRRHECRRFRPLRADGFAHHPYSRPTRPDARDLTKDRVQIGELDRLTGLLADLYVRGRLARPLPLYITEYGYETNPPDPRGHTPEDHSRYLGQATYLAWRHPEVRMFAQFLLEDIGPDISKPAGTAARWADYQTGLFHHNGRPKRSVVQGFRLPFFVETVKEPAGGTHTVAFGQVRPRSGAQNVVIQRLGAPGRWIVEASLGLLAPDAPPRTGFPTDADGFFLRRLPFRPGETYRAVWLAGDRLTRVSQEIRVGTPRPLVDGIGELIRTSG
ncbi:MAG TPA: hypothetical protein VGV10_06800 [Thermoleophilaceae bacterium]|nr:hypothetical protein [Thermoleophilaceae bacterium]